MIHVVGFRMLCSCCDIKLVSIVCFFFTNNPEYSCQCQNIDFITITLRQVIPHLCKEGSYQGVSGNEDPCFALHLHLPHMTFCSFSSLTLHFLNDINQSACAGLSFHITHDHEDIIAVRIFQSW